MTVTSSLMEALELAQATFNAASVPVVQPWSQELIKFLVSSVLGFSCLAFLISAVLLWRAKASPQSVLKVVGVISILCFSVLLLVIGYSNDQLTPIIGLFGAIAGYLLGKDAKQGDG
jgi:hypothetical protein